MLVLNNVATSDQYTTACTLGPAPSAYKVVYLVANASVIAQTKPYVPSSFTEMAWGPEILITPQGAEFDKCCAIRFRSAVPGTPAQVIAQLIEKEDPVPVGGTPFTAVLSGTGVIAPVQPISVVTTLPASPVNGQQVIFTDSLATPTYSWFLQYDSAVSAWRCLSGMPLWAGDLANTARSLTVTTSYQTYPSAPSVTVPRAGTYRVRLGGFISAPAGVIINLAPSIASGTPSNNNAAEFWAQVASYGASVVNGNPAIALLAGQTVALQMAGSSGGAATVTNSWVEILPEQVT